MRMQNPPEDISMPNIMGPGSLLNLGMGINQSENRLISPLPLSAPLRKSIPTLLSSSYIPLSP
jgi:hypothetical protein